MIMNNTIKSIGVKKLENFLIDFNNNPEKWYKDQVENNWEFDEDTQLKIIKNISYTKIGHTIEYIKNPTKNVCLEAVKNNALAIKYIKNPTEKIYLEAIKNNGYVIKYINAPTEEMYLEAVKKNGSAIEYIKAPTEKICLEAIKNNGLAIKYIDNPTEKMCLEAIKEGGYFICYILKKYQSFDIIQAFFDYNWSESKYNRDCYYKYLSKNFITKDQALIMIQDNPENINLVSEKIQIELLEMKPELRKFLV